ncbi:MAG: adenine phosphoribosyltransferase [Myxococcota bacterium]
MTTPSIDWKGKILDVPDWPKPGIVFKDITPLLADGPAFSAVTEAFAAAVRPWRPTQIIGVESRGFIFGAALANALGLGLTLVRKKGKLPRPTSRVTYALEYGEDIVEMHADALGANDRAVVIDDVLATGGTAAAVAELVRSSGAMLAGMAFLMELGFLAGRRKLPAGVAVASLTVI